MTTTQFHPMTGDALPKRIDLRYASRRTGFSESLLLKVVEQRGWHVDDFGKGLFLVDGRVLALPALTVCPPIPEPVMHFTELPTPA